MAVQQSTTRRALLGGATTIPILGGYVMLGEADPTIDACQKWLTLEAERNRLTAEWVQYGKFLSEKFHWDDLSDTEKDSLRETRKLDEIDAQLEALDWKSDTLLKAIPTIPAASAAAVAANLSVAKALLSPNVEPDVHGLIARAVRDLKALSHLI
jgi:hypothetical protein